MGQGNIIGYEINEKTCQISFYNEEMAEPETMEVDADNYQIPLVIGKLRDTWAYGKEAKRLASLKEGFTVNRLLDKSLAGEKIEFGEESYEAVWLLAKFIEDQRDRVQRSGADGRAGADAAGNRSTDEY